MNFSMYVATLAGALESKDGEEIAFLLRPTGTQAVQLVRELRDSSRKALAGFKGSIVSPWDEIAIAHAQVVVHAANKNYIEAYKEQAALAQAFLRFFITQTSWTLPILYTILNDLRNLAYQADQLVYDEGTSQATPGSMEDAARVINKAFSNCVTDRVHPLDVSRKWGIYYVVGLVMKCYFRINKTALSKNIIRALEANTDIPPLTRYPRGHQVTYRYYLGVLSFLQEDYAKSEEHLSFVFYNCPSDSERNQELALTYLIPIRLLRGTLPAATLLKRFPQLRLLYTPFIAALRKGDIKAFDRALQWAEPRLVDMGVWLTVEKAREVCLRGLFRKAWLVLNRTTRMPVSAFHGALRACGMDVPVEEAECLVANMIYKNYIKGYISHERGIVVLAAAHIGAFPNLKDRKEP